MRQLGTISFLLLVFGFILIGIPNHVEADERQIINLDGTWNIAEGPMGIIPEQFPYRVPVPGLVDLSSPDFFEVGIPSDRREAFWYQRTFTIEGKIPAIALLKVHKAKYGTKVYVNGKFAGEHLPCFTPGYFNVKPMLKGNGEENEVVIRVGAHKDSIPKTMPDGWDFEKYKYIPGIYDSVELILTDTPWIVNTQIAPHIENETIRVQVEVENTGKEKPVQLQYKVVGHKSKRIVTDGKTQAVTIPSDTTKKIDFTVEIPDGRLWSPEDPFLYALHLDCGTDTYQTRFAMRSFTFNAKTGRAVLNGKPYFMRGTNVCIYRFFEDTAREHLPWDKTWVRKLHKKFKSMNWNCIRYCIGFPPEFWYDIADELGILIQDEFPIWSLGEWPEELKADAIAKEYKEWMRERWNHPCVVMWDAQNESTTAETGKALEMVRDLDLSNRVWDNGWGLPQGPNDTLESHPYYFSKSWKEVKDVSLKEFSQRDGIPRVRKEQEKFKRPYIINEYAWLWINRDGSTTCLTENVYESLLGKNSTVEERRDVYARYLAAQTEFWRIKRQCAAVMHFCGLGYSRPGGDERPAAGATSDHFLDVAKLNFEPHFAKRMRDAFAPVGIMLDVWDAEMKKGSTMDVPVHLINDLYEKWNGSVRVRLQGENKIVSEQAQACTIEALGKTTLDFQVKLPRRSGRYELIAEHMNAGGRPVQSIRVIKVK